jgi:hypothetical protein
MTQSTTTLIDQEPLKASGLRSGLRIRTSITEGTASFLLNRCMNKLQQVQWPRIGF